MAENTRIRNGMHGWEGTTYYTGINGYDWMITTMKRSNGIISSSAQAGKFKDGENFAGFSFAMFTDPDIKLVQEKARATETTIKELHYKALAFFDELKEQDKLPFRAEAIGSAEVKVGQIIFLDAPYSNAGRDLAIYKIEESEWGTNYHYVDIENLRLGIAERVKPISQKFGIGYYYNPGETIDQVRLDNLVIDAKQKEREEREAELSEKVLQTAVIQAKIDEGRPLVKIPDWAKSVIVADHYVDKSDGQSDYYHTSDEDEKRVYLAYSRTDRNSMIELREAALKFEPTKDFGPGKGVFIPYVVTAETVSGNGLHRGMYKGDRSEWHRELTHDANGQRIEFKTRAEVEKYIAEHPAHSITFDGKTVEFVWDIREESLEHRGHTHLPSFYVGTADWSGWKVRKQRIPAPDTLYIAAAEGRYLCESEQAKTQAVINEITPDETGLTIYPGIHTKTGESIFTVKLGSRVSPDAFNSLRQRAKTFGGYYSSYTKDGAMPGFIFKTEDAAKQFIGKNAETISKAAKDIIRPEWDKMQEFIKKTDEQIKQPEAPAADSSPTGNFSPTKEVSINRIFTKPEAFQNRNEKFSQQTFDTIVSEGYDKSKEPIYVWTDPADGKYYILSGHSRFAAAQFLHNRDGNLDAIPVKEFYGTFDDAIDYATIRSNRESNKEGLKADINAYLRAVSRGYNKAELLKYFNPESYLQKLRDLSYLNPKGKFMEYLDTPQEASFPYLSRNATWVGELKRQYPNLSNAHESEMFDFLYKQGTNKLLLTKEAFTNLVKKKAGGMFFDPEAPLNLQNQTSTAGALNPGFEHLNSLRADMETRQGIINKNRDLIARARVENKPERIPEFEKEITGQTAKIIELATQIKKAEHDLAALERSTMFDLFSEEAAPVPEPTAKPLTAQTTRELIEALKLAYSISPDQHTKELIEALELTLNI